MPLSIDLHVKCPLYKSEIKRKRPFFFSWNFYTVFGEQIAIFYQIFKSVSSKKKIKCTQFTKVRTSSDFNENQPKEGRKIFYFFNFVSWYQNHKLIVVYIYPKVNYFPKIEDYISLENGKFEFLKLILSLKTMINGTFFLNPPPPPHEERSRFVSGCIW